MSQFITPSPGIRKVGYLLKTYPKISETFILQEILALEQRGMHLTIFSLQQPTDSQVPPSAYQVQADVHYIPQSLSQLGRRVTNTPRNLLARNPGRFRQALQFFERRKEGGHILEFYQAGYLASLLQELGISHLHAHFANEPTGIAELVHLLTDIPYSFTAHAKDIYLSQADILDRKMQQASFVLTCTQHNKDYLDSLSTTAVPIHRIYHGLHTTRFSAGPLRSPGDQPSPVPKLLSVGRFREKKGFPTLLAACGLLKQWGYRFHCRLIGYGPLQKDLERRIRAEGIQDRVTLLGKMTQDEVIDHYREADVFLLPCQIEPNGDRDGIPNVLMEAMAMQVPVVSTTVSGIPELVTHETHGLLVPPQDPTALARATARLLDDSEWRHRLGENGRQRILRDFSADTAAHTIQELFAGLSPARTPGPCIPHTDSSRRHLHAHQ